MSKLKVLIFIDWFYPGFSAGGPITSNLYLVERLNDWIDFYVITSNTDYSSSEVYNEVESDTWFQPKKEYNFKVFYASKQNQKVSTWRKLIQEVRPNALYINGMYSRKFSIAPTWLGQKMKLTTVVSPRGMLSVGSIGVKKLPKLLYLNSLNYFNRFNHCVFHATSEHEVEDISKVLGKNKKIRFIPNFNKPVPLKQEISIKREGELQLLTVARIAPEKNQLFAAEALNELQNLSGITWTLVGAIYNKEYFNKLNLVLEQLKKKDLQINLLGSLSPKEVALEVKKAHLLYLPTTGENFGHAIFEAFCDSTPVLISNLTPWRKLSTLEAGFDLPLNKSAFVQKIMYFKDLNAQQYFKYTEGALKLAKEFNLKQELEPSYLKLFSK